MNTLVVSCLILVTVATSARGCTEATIREICSTTNTEEYIRCASTVRKLLYTDCYESCNNCDCDSCYSCSSYCNNCCESCCQTRKTCTTKSCCRRTCNSNDCRSDTCRQSCNRDCTKRPSYPTSNNRTSYTTNTHHNSTQSLLNHTSAVHLHNFINTTNVILTPVKTNINSVNSIYPTYSPSQEVTTPVTGEPVPPYRNCCSVLAPRQCVPKSTWPFIECSYKKENRCGPICQAPIMHTYHQQLCQGGFCQQRPIYVPQPTPSYAYSPTWPFVSYGRPQGINCEGCYGHFFGHERISCNPFCYDEGYNIGPHFRQGPYFQPWYSPVPPCRVTVTCDLYGYQGNVLGNYPTGFNVAPFPLGVPPPNPILPNIPEIYTTQTLHTNVTGTTTPVNQTDH